MPTYGPYAITLDDVIAIAERAIALNTTDMEPEDIAFLADVVISTLLARDLLNEHRS